MWKPFVRRNAQTTSPQADTDQQNRRFFEDIWRQGDYWSLESDAFERAKYNRQLELICAGKCERVLEIGCGAGAFTRLLAPRAKQIVAIDVSPAAIKRAQSFGDAGGVIDYRAANILKYEPPPDQHFDVIVLAETIYYLGWLYTFFEMGWLATKLFDATADQGRLVLTNSVGDENAHLHERWLLKIYHDLFRHVGYIVESEESFLGTKGQLPLEAMISVYRKPAGARSAAAIG